MPVGPEPTSPGPHAARCVPGAHLTWSPCSAVRVPGRQQALASVVKGVPPLLTGPAPHARPRPARAPPRPRLPRETAGRGGAAPAHTPVSRQQLPDSCKAPRLVSQLHFTSWPDFGVPFTPIGMLKFLKKVKTLNPVHAGPIVVHCRCVGRGEAGVWAAPGKWPVDRPGWQRGRRARRRAPPTVNAGRSGRRGCLALTAGGTASARAPVPHITWEQGPFVSGTRGEP